MSKLNVFTVFMMCLSLMLMTLVSCDTITDLIGGNNSGNNPGNGPGEGGTTQTYTVTFNVNGGTGTAPASQTVNAGSSVTIPGGDGLIKEGFTFDGWNTKADGTEINYPAGTSLTVTGNITLYVKWDSEGITTPTTYTMTFDANGGSGIVSPQTVNAGSSITLESGSALSRSGYYFDGWNTNANGTGTNYPGGSSFTLTGNITLYAKWVSSGTPGLAFTLINDKTAYAVSKGTVTNGAVIIPASYNGLPVTEISNEAFRSAEITAVTIPSSVTHIKDYAFSSCPSLPSITIPSSVTFIGNNAFDSCGILTNVTIPSSVTYIGNEAFAGCISLTSIIIPSSVTYIGDKTFQACTKLASVTIPSSVTSIGDSAFLSCNSLTSVNIPSGVTQIKDYAFSSCTKLTSVTIASSVTSIGDGVFNACISLTSINISSGVTLIGTSMFADCRSLTSINIPSSVTSINSGAFSGCTILSTIIIPSSVMYIGNGAFSGWGNSQTINVQGHASQASVDALWGTNWRRSCNANIVYQG